MARRPRITYVGDSMGVGTVPYLRENARVRADVLGGRGSADGVSALKRLLAGRDPDRVVFDLGTNDWTVDDLRRSLKRTLRLTDAPVTALTVHGRQAGAKNALLRRFAKRGDIDLVRWARDSDGLLSSDGIHATGEGYEERARMLLEAASAGGRERQRSRQRPQQRPRQRPEAPLLPAENPPPAAVSAMPTSMLAAPRITSPLARPDLYDYMRRRP